MAITDKNEHPKTPPGGVYPPRAVLIEVSYDQDGSPHVDNPVVIVAPGEEIIWCTPRDEQRAFNVALAEDFPGECGPNYAPAHARSTSMGQRTQSDVASPGGDEPASSPAQHGEVLQSGPLQATRIRIRPDAADGVFAYGVAAEPTSQGKMIVFAGGVIIRGPGAPVGGPHYG